MAVSVRRRIPALVGLMVSALALALTSSPALAQAGGPGAQATPAVGISGTANCPTPVPAAQVVYNGPAGPFILTGAGGSCTSFSANSQGTFTVGGSGPGEFSSSCQAAGLQHGGGVTVPTGTIVNGVAVTQPTVITTLNTPVVFPGGVAATLNVVQTTATTVTRTAIVSGGTSIGRVICGAANVYPLAVETAAGGAPAVGELPTAGGDGGGGVNTALLAAAALAIVLAAQVVIARRRRSGATD